MNREVIELKRKQETSAQNHEAAGRHDIYRNVHKALRSYMGEVLAEVGRLDVEDDAEVSQTMAEVRQLLGVLRAHLEAENRFLHWTMHDRLVGSADKTAVDHVGHERAIERLANLSGEVEQRTAAQRRSAWEQLYRELGVFVGENLEHMNYEEVENNAVLWATHTDEELLKIERAIVAGISPEKMALFMRWMIPSIAPAERAHLLSKIRQTAPAQVFEGVLAIARARLTERDWHKLQIAIGSMPKAA
jgi:iron-sulfur cluster repair protein YtfE (RIC family)